MAVGREGNPILRRQQDLPGRPVNGRHLPLREEPHVLEAKLPVFLEKLDRGLVVLGARHDVEGDCVPMASRQGDDLLGVNLKRLADETGPIGNVPFGPS